MDAIATTAEIWLADHLHYWASHKGQDEIDHRADTFYGVPSGCINEIADYIREARKETTYIPGFLRQVQDAVVERTHAQVRRTTLSDISYAFADLAARADGLSALQIRDEIEMLYGKIVHEARVFTVEAY